MRIEIASFTLNGASLARQLASLLKEEGHETFAYAAEKYSEATGLPSTGGIHVWTQKLFSEADALVYIGAAGIAVRAIAPFLKSKLTDPAVLSLDEKGRFVVPLVSGHVGGANRLAECLAEITGGQAVVSTATDVNGLFAVDEWIARRGMTMIGKDEAREFADALLEGKKVGLTSEFPVSGSLPKNVCVTTEAESGLYVGIRTEKPYAHTVCAVPKIIHMGIGCRRNTPEEAIREAVEEALKQYGIQKASIRDAASIELKKDEQGLLTFCRTEGLPITFFTAEQLKSVEGEFTASERVLRVTGVDNVCERAACALGGTLLMKKFAHNGVTVALSAEPFLIEFEEK